MKVRIMKLVPEAVIPSYAHDTDAGLDLVATSTSYDRNNGVMTIGCGLAFEMPEGHVGLLFPRSSVYKQNLLMTNCVGVIDSGYRGEVMAKFYIVGPDNMYKVGDRFAQLIIMPYPKIELVESNELSSSERGTGGHGSTGL